MKPNNELCTPRGFIDNWEECQLAAYSLGLSFVEAVSDEQYIKGCYSSKGGKYTYWNNMTYTGKFSYDNPICKLGEQIEQITANALNTYN